MTEKATPFVCFSCLLPNKQYLLFVFDSFKKGSIRSYFIYSRKGFSFIWTRSQRTAIFLLRTQRLTKKMGNYSHEDQKTHSNARPKAIIPEFGIKSDSESENRNKRKEVARLKGEERLQQEELLFTSRKKELSKESCLLRKARCPTRLSSEPA